MEQITLNRETRRLLERFSGKTLPEMMSNENIIALLEKELSKLEPNLIMMADAYKYSHPLFYEPGLEKMYSYVESRGGKFGELVMFGLQYIMKKYLVGRVLSEQMVEEATEKLLGENGVFGKDGYFNKEGWLSLVRKHNGTLPIIIKSAPEGTVIPVKNIMMSVESNDSEFAWLSPFLETLLLRVWYPITVATLSREVKKVVAHYLEKTGTSPDIIPIMVQFILNDFSARGVSSEETAAIGGAAHLVSHMGSDNLAGAEMLMKFYNTKIMYSKSIAATEHSICTMRGEAGELEVFRRVLLSNPKGIVACVSDSYNILRACMKYWGEELKDIILAREGVLVVRPDSGDPVRTLLEVYKILFEKFGYETNSKGFKVLPKQIRVIQGDGVNYDSIIKIYKALEKAGIAAENLVLGMGGKLCQAGIDRDLQNFAMKASYAVIKGEGVFMVKAPTEIDKDGNIQPSFKKSKTGLLKLIINDDGKYETINNLDTRFETAVDILVPVFENGKLLVDYKIEDIRKDAEIDYLTLCENVPSEFEIAE